MATLASYPAYDLLPAPGMDVLTLLKNDHDEVKRLFKQIEDAEGAKARELWQQISSRLSLHEELEETLFYPPLRQEEAAKDLILESYQEHHVMDVLMKEISGLKPSDEAWQPKIKVLQENTEHHIEEEEGELFPKVRKIWKTDKREEVGRQMQKMKEQRQKQRSAA
ncbi:MAG: hemerythrin domain-containing protein [Chloroflexi bacterium]|nr:hemerythrin domain-containing protein [Chloroflexota bacterium]